MKSILTYLILWAGVVSALAQTNVEGNQSGTWTLSGSPYLVTNSIDIPSGEQLVIEPGVEVNFQDNYRFHIHGKLIAEGTVQDSIRFTAVNPATGWGGLRFDNTQEISQLSYCKFTYGKTMDGDYPDQHGGAVMLDNSDIVIRHCLFSNNDATADSNGMGGALYGINTGSDTQIVSCTFTANHSYGEGGAIKLTGDEGMNIENCIFKDNSVLYGGGAIALYGCYDTYIYKCLFTGNQTSYAAGGAVAISGYSAGVRFVNCTMTGNHALGGDAGAVEIAFSDASFTNCIVRGNDGPYSDNIYLDYGYAEINYCDTPFPDGATGSNNIDEDAMFVDAAQGDFHLQEGSPCIDAGIASLSITDAYGTTIQVIDLDPDEYAGSAPDMGCYEWGYSAATDEPGLSAVSIYPNPVSHSLYITSEEPIRHISLFDMSGQLIRTFEAQGNRQQVNVSFLEPGFYLLRMHSAKGDTVRKFVKKAY